MQVLFPFVGDTVGGSHISAMLLIRHLRSDRFSPRVLLHRDGPLSKRLRHEGIAFDIVPLPFFSPPAGRLRAILRLITGLPGMIRLLRDGQIDVVHTNDARSLVSWALPCCLAGVALVHHQRTRFSVSRIPNAALALTREIIAISSYNLDSLPTRFRRKATVIFDPYEAQTAAAEHAAAKARLLRRFGRQPGACLVGFVGTLQDQKRPLVFLAAAARMLALSHLPLHFVMLGRAEGEALRQVTAGVAVLGLAERVTIAGYIPDAEAAIAGLDILLAPAVDEGFGRAVVEGMLAGIPVVAADSGGHREALGAVAEEVLVPADDAEALAVRALALLRDPALAGSIGLRLRQEAERQMSATAHACAVEAVYERVAS